MSTCIYKTHPNWHTFLAQNGLKKETYFWRNSQSNIRLSNGDDFYFVNRISKEIVGLGTFSNIYNLTIADGWNQFGKLCGADNLKNLISDISGVNIQSNINKNSNIQLIKLTNTIWLNEKKYIFADEDIFSNWSNGRLPYRINISRAGMIKLNNIS